jgi:phosphoribosylformylglycinamidine synthase subunit PurQ / glutaminase
MKNTSLRFWVLEGFGIECEKESHRFFSQLGAEHERLFLPEILSGTSKKLDEIREGDWIFFPGGFSFADHFGSGTLLSFELKKSKILPRLLDRGCNFFGVCNGFQVLTSLGLFGKETRLLHNEVEGAPIGFVNRWATLRYELSEQEKMFRFTVRHGEGRIDVPSKTYLEEQGARIFLRYADEQFQNGSFDRCAGLLRRQGKSWIVGMMPHPEIAVRAVQDPARFSGEAMPQQRNADFVISGDGPRFFNKLLEDLEISR